MSVPNTFASATSSIPLANLDANFAYYDAAFSISGTAVTFAGNITLTSGTANGVAYLDGSKVLTTGSALTFDGNTLTSTTGGLIITNAASSLSITAINFGSLSGGAYINTPSGNTGHLAVAGNGAYSWTSTTHIWSISASEQMRLTSTGLGIGTSSPTLKLDVNGSAKFAGSYVSFNDNGYIRTDATNILRFQPGSGGYQFRNTGNSDNLAVLDASGNLGLGVTPSAWISSTVSLDMRSTSAYADVGGSTTIANNSYRNSGGGWIYKTTNFASRLETDTGAFRWFNAPSGTAGNAITFTQAMTLTALGSLQIGTTTSNPTTGFAFIGPGESSVQRMQTGHPTGTATGSQYAEYLYNGTIIGSITQDGTTAVLYNTTSDQRLKENIQDAAPASALIDAIQVRQFDWQSDGSHQRYGFVAQELVTVAPEAVHAPADPDEMMAVDYSKLVPLLVKELQSLRARVAQLESKP